MVTPHNNPPQPETPPVVPDNKPTDESTFQKLSTNALQTDGTFGSASLVKIALANKNIQLDMVPNNFTLMPDLAESNIQTLRDKAGNLVGYSGYAQVNDPQKDLYGDPAPSIPRRLYLQGVDDESLQQRPTSDMNYLGKMMYSYFDKNQATGLNEIADVKATYSNNDKTMTMTIDNPNNADSWTLYSEKSSASAKQVNVDEHGKMVGYLLHDYNKSEKPKYNGNFSGGFYGENGSVLIGTGHYNGSDAEGTGKWQGVIGATAQ